MKMNRFQRMVKAWEKTLYAIPKDERPKYFGQRVTLRSWQAKLRGKTGLLKGEKESKAGNQYWVLLDEPHINTRGKLSRWHVCNSNHIILQKGDADAR